MKKFSVKTSEKKQIVDITGQVVSLLRGVPSEKGLCHLFVLHTTACLTTADLDPGTDLDMLDAFKEMIPQLRYRHPHNPEHVGDHILSSVIGPSVVVPFERGALLLGTWQRVVLIELDGPREREIIVSFLSALA